MPVCQATSIGLEFASQTQATLCKTWVRKSVEGQDFNEQTGGSLAWGRQVYEGLGSLTTSRHGLTTFACATRQDTSYLQIAVMSVLLLSWKEQPRFRHAACQRTDKPGGFCFMGRLGEDVTRQDGSEQLAMQVPIAVGSAAMRSTAGKGGYGFSSKSRSPAS